MKLITQGTTDPPRRPLVRSQGEAMTMEMFVRECRQALSLIKLAHQNKSAGETRAAIHQGLRKIERVKAEVTRRREALRERAA